MDNKLFNFSKRLIPQVGAESVPAPVNESDVISSDSQLLDYIYGLDPVSQLPCGDLAIYLGDKANPEIRNFIEMNLLQERMDIKSNMSIPQDVLNKMREVVTDDDIATFTRNHGESKEEYADRLKLYFLKEKEHRRQQGYLKKVKDLADTKND